jgi:hypothetical protein
MPPQQLERLLDVGGDGFDFVTHGLSEVVGVSWPVDAADTLSTMAALPVNTLRVI